MGLVWPSLQRCLVAWGCCLWEQCSTYENLIENSCFQLPAVPQRTHQLSIIWSRSREKPPFSCGIKVWGVYIFIIPIDYFNLLQRANVAHTNGVNSNFDKADRTSWLIDVSDYCIFRADGKITWPSEQERLELFKNRKDARDELFSHK